MPPGLHSCDKTSSMTARGKARSASWVPWLTRAAVRRVPRDSPAIRRTQCRRGGITRPATGWRAHSTVSQASMPAWRSRPTTAVVGCALAQLVEEGAELAPRDRASGQIFVEVARSAIEVVSSRLPGRNGPPAAIARSESVVGTPTRKMKQRRYVQRMEGGRGVRSGTRNALQQYHLRARLLDAPTRRQSGSAILSATDFIDAQLCLVREEVLFEQIYEGIPAQEASHGWL